LGGKGSQAAIDVAKCADANHCLGSIEPSTELAIATPQQCIQEKCPNQLNACRADHKCFPALQDCEIKCKQNQTCFTTCIAGKGDAAASDLWKCIVDNDCIKRNAELERTAGLFVWEEKVAKLPSMLLNALMLIIALVLLRSFKHQTIHSKLV